MGRISVVVPIYNVEPYLEECLRSLLAQTERDLEIVMVDDGSTDASAAIAQRFAARDARFRLIRCPNGGLGRARNVGIDAATGEFLAFLDSDDVLPPRAYELLSGALAQSGSDFACGNVLRLTDGQLTQAAFLARTFARTQLATHVTRFAALLGDRTAWNKLWRRSFWDAQALRFPEGVLHEDIPVVLPAHLRARSVDVLAEPVYHWRARPGEDCSITQRRLEHDALRDRLDAVAHVREVFAAEAPPRLRRWYDERLVADDLRLYLDVLLDADDAYRALFVERVNALLGRADAAVFDALAAIDRLKWHLVRRGLLDELLEVLRFEREGLTQAPPLRIRGRWYGDYPFRGDRALAIPSSVYRLGRDDRAFALGLALDELRADGGALRLRGRAHIAGIGAPQAGRQRVRLVASRPGRWQRARLWLAPVRLATSPVRVDGVDPALAWSGFEATLEPRALRRLGRWRDGTWELYANVRAGGVRRRWSRFAIADAAGAGAVDLPAPGGAVAIRARPAPGGKVALRVAREWLTVRSHRLVDGHVLELVGELRLAGGGAPALELRRASDGLVLPCDVTVSGGSRRRPARFRARVSLVDLWAASPTDVAGEEPEARVGWQLEAVSGGTRRTVALPAEVAGAAWRAADLELSLQRDAGGDATLTERDLRPLVTHARWTVDGALELGGWLPADVGWQDLVLVGAGAAGSPQTFTIHTDRSSGRFVSRVAPAHVRALGRRHGPREGRWELQAQRAGGSGEPLTAPLRVARSIAAELPLAITVEGRPYGLHGTEAGTTALVVHAARPVAETPRDGEGGAVTPAAAEG